MKQLASALMFSCLAASLAAQSPTPSARCVAPTTASRRTGGSTSPKSSTPVGHRSEALEARETPGANTAKGSTPIGSATTPSAATPRTAGSLTPKGSTPTPCTP